MTRPFPYLLAAACIVSACAVGPNYRAPAAPSTAGFVPPAALPSSTVSAPIAGGEAQRFVDGMDIPGQWWTLYQSPELNALIERVHRARPRP